MSKAEEGRSMEVGGLYARLAALNADAPHRSVAKCVELSRRQLHLSGSPPKSLVTLGLGVENRDSDPAATDESGYFQRLWRRAIFHYENWRRRLKRTSRTCWRLRGVKARWTILMPSLGLPSFSPLILNSRSDGDIGWRNSAEFSFREPYRTAAPFHDPRPLYRLIVPLLGYVDERVATGKAIVGVNFADAPATGSISGEVFGDFNVNGKLDSTELGLGLWQVYIDANKDGKYNAGDVLSTTDINGSWSFTGLIAGTYALRVVQVSKTATTTAGGTLQTIMLVGGQVVAGKLFGEERIAWGLIYG